MIINIFLIENWLTRQYLLLYLSFFVKQIFLNRKIKLTLEFLELKLEGSFLKLIVILDIK